MALDRIAAKVESLTTNREVNNALAGGPMRTVVRTNAGVPTDALFRDAVDGMMVLDTTNLRLYIRRLGVWRYATLT